MWSKGRRGEDSWDPLTWRSGERPIPVSVCILRTPISVHSPSLSPWPLGPREKGTVSLKPSCTWLYLPSDLVTQTPVDGTSQWTWISSKTFCRLRQRHWTLQLLRQQSRTWSEETTEAPGDCWSPGRLLKSTNTVWFLRKCQEEGGEVQVRWWLGWVGSVCKGSGLVVKGGPENVLGNLDKRCIGGFSFGVSESLWRRQI